MKKLMLFGCLALLSVGAAFAGDSPRDVDAAIKAGNYSLAEQDLRAALVEHPQSARAHYILAQVLAHQGNIGEAKTQAAEARRLDPRLGFTDPSKFNTFQGELDRALAPPSQRATSSSRAAAPAAFEMPARQPQPRQASIWPWVIGLLVIGGLVAMFLRRRRAASLPMNAGGYDQRGPGYAPPYGQQPYGQQPGGGSGIGGAFVGGLAGGALGAAAVNMYENHERNEAAEHAGSSPGSGTVPSTDPSAQAYEDLRDDPIDMGNGGDSWGGDSIDTGGSDDDTSW